MSQPGPPSNGLGGCTAAFITGLPYKAESDRCSREVRCSGAETLE